MLQISYFILALFASCSVGQFPSQFLGIQQQQQQQQPQLFPIQQQQQQQQPQLFPIQQQQPGQVLLQNQQPLQPLQHHQVPQIPVQAPQHPAPAPPSHVHHPAQEQAGPRRILEAPVPHLCANRAVHETFGGKGYWFSWKDPANNKERDWLDGRNFCRQRCMDLVSLETSVENEFVKKRIVEGQQKYIWTSGRLCDFKGCDREDLKPTAINGWFWSGELRKLAPVTNRLQNDWSASGGIKKPQPDNREYLQGGAVETCLAVLNNFYGDGVHWHDVACHHKKPIVCEDSEALLKYVRYTNPNIRV